MMIAYGRMTRWQSRKAGVCAASGIDGDNLPPRRICRIENVETFKMRHAPLFQWAASGCVIRKSVFHESDGQWHSGWTNENLIEQCVIESVRGHGVMAKTSSFDHIIKNNVFVLKDGKSPMISLATADCVGTEIVGNKLLGGSGRIVSGKAKPALLKNNKALPPGQAPRPSPKVPSIYEWQLHHVTS